MSSIKKDKETDHSIDDSHWIDLAIIKKSVAVLTTSKSVEYRENNKFRIILFFIAVAIKSSTRALKGFQQYFSWGQYRKNWLREQDSNNNVYYLWTQSINFREPFGIYCYSITVVRKSFIPDCLPFILTPWVITRIPWIAILVNYFLIADHLKYQWIFRKNFEFTLSEVQNIFDVVER